ncbi:uncharacterized protein [Choristoneura fumiferana]|uniref:uncharacterized protein n=1 Tax=Choristoneura fumiferana TaxID=7141 RepID=UPI003D157ADB
MAVIKESNASLRAELARAGEESTALRERLDLMQKTLEDQEQKSRQCNIEIQNLPEKQSENLMHLVITMGKVINVPIAKESIRAVHRVEQNVKNDRPKNVVVELCSRRIRDDIITAVRTRRGLTAGQILESANADGAHGTRINEQLSSRPIYVNEHLTLKNKILYAKTRKEASTKKYKWAWVKNAAILVRKDDRTKAIRVRSEADLAKL